MIMFFICLHFLCVLPFLWSSCIFSYVCQSSKMIYVAPIYLIICILLLIINQLLIFDYSYKNHSIKFGSITNSFIFTSFHIQKLSSTTKFISLVVTTLIRYDQLEIRFQKYLTEAANFAIWFTQRKNKYFLQFVPVE